MPTDHKRINGPEETLPYYLFTKLNTQSQSHKVKDILKAKKRNDDRPPLDHRKICKVS